MPQWWLYGLAPAGVGLGQLCKAFLLSHRDPVLQGRETVMLSIRVFRAALVKPSVLSLSVLWS